MCGGVRESARLCGANHRRAPWIVQSPESRQQLLGRNACRAAQSRMLLLAHSHRDSSISIFARPANVAVGQVLVPSGAADSDRAGVAEIARRDVAEGHPAIDTFAGVLILDALAVRRIADFTFGTLDVRVRATRVGIAEIVGAGITVGAVDVVMRAACVGITTILGAGATRWSASTIPSTTTARRWR